MPFKSKLQQRWMFAHMPEKAKEWARKTSFKRLPERAERKKVQKVAKKSMRPGGGGRFAKLTKELKSEGKSEESAKAIAASIGRKKYGKKKMAEFAAKGRKRSSTTKWIRERLTGKG